MGYASLGQCVADLERHGQLKRIDYPIDPHLEMGVIQRRAFRAQAPALLFTRPKGCRFPMLANLFGSRERLNFIFRTGIETVREVFQARARPWEFLKQPLRALRLVRPLLKLRPRRAADAPCLARQCALADLPRLVSWPLDGGPFITLPLVYSRHPETARENLGMYRVQLAGSAYAADEVGLHYQTQRGIGCHHAAALEQGARLPVHIYVGGAPALAIAAVMPLPEGMSELLFASLLAGRRLELTSGPGFALPCISQCDFLLQGEIMPETRPEGPFGDHVGYYSLKHEFPAVKIARVFHREDAIWPFTTVGRPPQEDTIFGDFIHELTAPLVGQVFPGIREVRAVDAAGVHPLLLALGAERYTPYEARRRPRELITQAMHLLGYTQTSLAKYLLIGAHEDAPGLSTSRAGDFLVHMLERANFSEDLHFIAPAPCDTLDYTGSELHVGSKLIWASAGEPRRTLATALAGALALPAGFGRPRIALPGVLVVQGPSHRQARGVPDAAIEFELVPAFERWQAREGFPLVVVSDDAQFTAQNLDNFLWVTFTRSDPATDTYGAFAKTGAKRWGCQAPLIIDARLKRFHAPPLEEDGAVVARVEQLARRGGPLAGLI